MDHLVCWYVGSDIYFGVNGSWNSPIFIILVSLLAAGFWASGKWAGERPTTTDCQQQLRPAIAGEICLRFSIFTSSISIVLLKFLEATLRSLKLVWLMMLFCHLSKTVHSIDRASRRAKMMHVQTIQPVQTGHESWICGFSCLFHCGLLNIRALVMLLPQQIIEQFYVNHFFVACYEHWCPINLAICLMPRHGVFY